MKPIKIMLWALLTGVGGVRCTPHPGFLLRGGAVGAGGAVHALKGGLWYSLMVYSVGAASNLLEFQWWTPAQVRSAHSLQGDVR